ncbi:MAG TPA: hypothetical protein VGG03_16285, partial [Thermoanaerobaculia bacterium]
MPARTPSVHQRRWLEPLLEVSLEPTAQRGASPQAATAAEEVRRAELRVLGRARESAAARSCRPRRMRPGRSPMPEARFSPLDVQRRPLDPKRPSLDPKRSSLDPKRPSLD